MGRISAFGLMELSRQRRRTGILEGTTTPCPHCAGAGRIRSPESAALGALRALETEALKGGGEVVLRAARETGLYLLNHKRDYLVRLTDANGLFVNVVLDDNLAQADHLIERISSAPPGVVSKTEERRSLVTPDIEQVDEPEEEEDFDEEEIEDEAPVSVVTADDDAPRRRNRRRRRGRSSDEPRPAPVDAAGEGEPAQGRRRRGRRGGRRPREATNDAYAWSWPARLSGEDPYEWRGPVERQPAEAVAGPEPEALEPVAVAEITPPVTSPAPAAIETAEIWVELPEPEPAAEPKPKARRRREKAPAPLSEEPSAAPPEVAPALPVDAPSVVLAVDNPAPAPTPPDPSEIVSPPSSPRRGWWRRS
jgi:ribonuclease E